MKSTQPIGVFDSGIGGLTVAHAIQKILPNEQMIYFGDIAHLPYGEKSEAAIQAYSVKIADILLNHKCKVIVIACNSASSAAYELLKEYVNKKALVLDVIDPMVRLVKNNFKDSVIGLIGTRRTVQSGVYERKIQETNAGIALRSLATPLLVPMIEEGFFNNTISHDVIRQYLTHPNLQNIRALILACTHYPLIKKEIEDFYEGSVRVLDSSEVIAQSLKEILMSNELLNASSSQPHTFFVSDYTESFETSTKMFFGEKVLLKKYNPWQ